MRKGLAIPYIIALVLAIIILAIGGYLMYRAFTEGKLSCQECKAQFTTWCSMCYLGNPPWSADYELGEDLSECVGSCGYWSGTDEDTKCTDTEAPDACSGMGVPF